MSVVCYFYKGDKNAGCCIFMCNSRKKKQLFQVSRPTLAQVKAVIDFMQKHPDLAHRKLRYGVSHQKFKKLWIELSNIANSIDGAVKSTKGWIKVSSSLERNTIEYI